MKAPIKYLRFTVLVFVLGTQCQLFSQSVYSQPREFDGYLTDIIHHQTDSSFYLIHEISYSKISEPRLILSCYDHLGQIRWEHLVKMDLNEDKLEEHPRFCLYKPLLLKQSQERLYFVYAKYEKHRSHINGYASFHLVFDSDGKLISREKKPETDWFVYYPLSGSKVIKMEYNRDYLGTEPGDCVCTHSTHYNEAQFSLGEMNEFHDFHLTKEVSTPFWLSELLYDIPVQVFTYQDSLLAGFITTANKQLPKEQYNRELCNRDVVFWIDENRDLQTIDYGSNSLQLRRRVNRVFEYADNIAVIYSEAHRIPYQKSLKSHHFDYKIFPKATWDSILNNSFRRNPFVDTVTSVDTIKVNPFADSTSVHLVIEYNPASVFLSAIDKKGERKDDPLLLFSEEEYGTVIEAIAIGDSSWMIVSLKLETRDLYFHQYNGALLAWRRVFSLGTPLPPPRQIGKPKALPTTENRQGFDIDSGLIPISKDRLVFYCSLNQFMGNKSMAICLSQDGSAIFPPEIKSEFVE